MTDRTGSYRTHVGSGASWPVPGFLASACQISGTSVRRASWGVGGREVFLRYCTVAGDDVATTWEQAHACTSGLSLATEGGTVAKGAKQAEGSGEDHRGLGGGVVGEESE